MAFSKKRLLLYILLAVVGVLCLFLAADYVMVKTSTTKTCLSCHYHSDADAKWKMSSHYRTDSGVVTDCADCHLPPHEEFIPRALAKSRMSMKDIWSYMVKNPEDIDWEAKSEVEYAYKIVFNNSCKHCHVNIYPEGISDDGISAHLYYEDHEKELDLQCISCHLDVGHYNPSYSHQALHANIDDFIKSFLPKYTEPAKVDTFRNFKETIPGTTASINMLAIPGGTFLMGSGPREPFREADEGPQRRVTVSPFFMGECEVTWDQYWAFYRETMSEGRTPPEQIYANNSRPDVDAVSGPTPPFGNPDQGWGMGSRPAITMTHYAAETFCQWLSLKTGRHYRLPTEAEWEYAARGGTDSPYFFEGSPRLLSSQSLIYLISKPDTSVIASYAVYELNSRNRTKTPEEMLPNPFGLKNMLGNVMEYCSDWYAEDAYEQLEDGVIDPKGPSKGKEHVVRGGKYNDDAAYIRCATRASTHHALWLKTDPQKPKSIWWYSDMKGIGFRVVCDVPEELKQ